MRFPFIGLFWGAVFGIFGPQVGMTVWGVLIMAFVFSICTCAVRDWAEKNLGG